MFSDKKLPRKNSERVLDAVLKSRERRESNSRGSDSASSSARSSPVKRDLHAHHQHHNRLHSAQLYKQHSHGHGSRRSRGQDDLDRVLDPKRRVARHHRRKSSGEYELSRGTLLTSSSGSNKKPTVIVSRKGGNESKYDGLRVVSASSRAESKHRAGSRESKLSASREAKMGMSPTHKDDAHHRGGASRGPRFPAAAVGVAGHSVRGSARSSRSDVVVRSTRLDKLEVPSSSRTRPKLRQAERAAASIRPRPGSAASARTSRSEHKPRRVGRNIFQKSIDPLSDDVRLAPGLRYNDSGNTPRDSLSGKPDPLQRATKLTVPVIETATTIGALEAINKFRISGPPAGASSAKASSRGESLKLHATFHQHSPSGSSQGSGTDRRSRSRACSSDGEADDGSRRGSGRARLGAAKAKRLSRHMTDELDRAETSRKRLDSATLRRTKSESLDDSVTDMPERTLQGRQPSLSDLMADSATVTPRDLKSKMSIETIITRYGHGAGDDSDSDDGNVASFTAPGDFDDLYESTGGMGDLFGDSDEELYETGGYPSGSKNILDIDDLPSSDEEDSDDNDYMACSIKPTTSASKRRIEETEISNAELDSFQSEAYFEHFAGKSTRRGNGTEGHLTSEEIAFTRAYATFGDCAGFVDRSDKEAQFLAYKLYCTTGYESDHFLERWKKNKKKGETSVSPSGSS